MVSSIKRRTYEVLEGTRKKDRLSQAVQWFIIVLIVFNITAFVLATVPWLERQYGIFFSWFERLSVGVFTVEYVLRVWACTEDERFTGRPVRGRLHFMATPAAAIDLLAILPFYLPRATGALDFRAIRALRLFRLLRLLKLGRFSQSIVIFTEVLKNKREQIFVAAIAVSVMLVFASSLMYVAEHRVQPDAFSSIPAAMWWGTVTLTTVGYGDVTPVTTAGKILGGLIAILGIGLFALPAGILSSGFEEALDHQLTPDGEQDEAEAEPAPDDGEASDDEENAERGEAARQAPHYCPHCGEPLPS